MNRSYQYVGRQPAFLLRGSPGKPGRDGMPGSRGLNGRDGRDGGQGVQGIIFKGRNVYLKDFISTKFICFTSKRNQTRYQNTN